ncbi:MAG TPA: helix-turn-helix transcriptional regulator, partial [Candidatus Dormibacteraeota bacterium]|nr:helix-turn-helix transcriptional regulator [Candidatus Dormibacteraeota bacterium]
MAEDEVLDRQAEKETLGQRIKRIRLQRGMSLAKVVRDDFSRAFLNQVELGKARPSIRVLRIIADRLGTEVEYLLEGQEAGIERELALERGRV